MDNKEISFTNLINSKPSSTESIAYGQQLWYNFFDKFIDKYKGILIVIISIAMIVLIVFLIANMSMVKMNLHPIEYCIQALKEAGCTCNGRTYV